MKKKMMALAILGAAAMSVFSNSASAATLDLTGLLLPSVVVAGPSGGHSFTATIEAGYYAHGTSGYNSYASYFAPGSLTATDSILAYIVNNDSILPTSDSLMSFTVNSGSFIDAVAVVPASGGDVGAFGFATNNAATAKANFFFTGGGIPQFGESTILLFAATGIPALQNATVQDGVSGNSLVLSLAGPLGGGTPLPVPAAACGGLGMLGLLAGSRMRRTRA